MARFNAAFMSGSIDEKFQNRYNYLLDLLDTGYIVEKMIGNSMSRIEVSPSVGIKISYGTTDMLSIDPTTGDLRVSGDIYVERLRASGSDDYMGFVKYGWGDTAINFVTGDNDLPVQNMTEYLSITGDADTFTSSMLTILDATPRLVSTEVKRNFATTLRVGVNQSLSAMDEENTAYLTINGNAANPSISLTAVGATFATRSELKVEDDKITLSLMPYVGTTPIIESGSNANGSWIKYADGTMICSLTILHNIAISTAMLGGFRSPGRTWTFPVEFYATPVCVASGEPVDSFSYNCNGKSTTYASYIYTSITSQGLADRTINMVAIGRWKA